MCGGENTAQAASVEYERRRRSNDARRSLHPLYQNGIFFDNFNDAAEFLRGVANSVRRLQRLRLFF